MVKKQFRRGKRTEFPRKAEGNRRVVAARNVWAYPFVVISCANRTEPTLSPWLFVIGVYIMERPFLSAPANSPKPTISTPVRPPRRFALQICADRNACTSIWRFSLSFSLLSSYRFLLFWRHLSVSRSSFVTGNSTDIYIYIYLAADNRLHIGVPDTIVSRMTREWLTTVSSFSIPSILFLLFSVFFLFFYFFSLEHGNYRYSLIERLLLYSKYMENSGKRMQLGRVTFYSTRSSIACYSLVHTRTILYIR